MDTSLGQGDKKSAYGIEYGLVFRKGCSTATNFEFLIYYGTNNCAVENEEIHIAG